MWENKIKNQKGITLAALVVYISVMTIVIATVTVISTFFYDRIGDVVVTPKYAAEINKFIMFFAVDVKDYSSATVTDTTIQFDNGPTYTFEDNTIYRNDTKIAEKILNCTFSSDQYTVNSVTKNLINVTLKAGKNNNDFFEKTITYTLKYW